MGSWNRNRIWVKKLVKFIYLCIYLKFIWEGERMLVEEERERIRSQLRSVSVEPDVNLELTNHDIMTWPQIKSQMLNRLSHPDAPILLSNYKSLRMSTHSNHDRSRNYECGTQRKMGIFKEAIYWSFRNLRKAYKWRPHVSSLWTWRKWQHLARSGHILGAQMFTWFESKTCLIRSVIHKVC